MRREEMSSKEILKQLEALSNPRNVEGMARFGINPEKTYGVPIPTLRKMAKGIGKNHALAQQLWGSGIHEARLLATMIDDSEKVTEAQMESWVADFNSWDICDQCCSNLFDKTELAYQKAIEWSAKEREFTKRAGFVLMATSAVHDKSAPDEQFERFLPIIKRESTDERNFVWKAVDWALRQIGKRNLSLNQKAIETAKEIRAINSRSAKAIASRSLSELTDAKVKERLQRASKKS